MPTTNIDDLPDVALVLIFSKLPTRDLVLNIAFVCPRWALLQPRACQNKTSLFLSDQPNPQWNELYSFFCDDTNTPDLMVKFEWRKHRYSVRQNQATSQRDQDEDIKLNITNCELFALRLPNLTHLTLIYKDDQFTNIIVSMLSNWSRTLTHLKLIGNFNWPLLKDSINSLRSLKDLSINVDISLLNELSLSITENLHEFHCQFSLSLNNSFVEFDKNVVQLVGSNIRNFGLELHKTNLPNVHFNFINDLKIPQWPSVIKGKLSHFKGTIENQLDLLQICDKCSSITHLQLTLSYRLGTPMLEHVLTALSKLTHLTELFLCIDKMKKVAIDEGDNPFAKISPFVSVRKAQFLFAINHMQIPMIKPLFPNVIEPIQFCVNFEP